MDGWIQLRQTDSVQPFLSLQSALMLLARETQTPQPQELESRTRDWLSKRARLG